MGKTEGDLITVLEKMKGDYMRRATVGPAWKPEDKLSTTALPPPPRSLLHPGPPGFLPIGHGIPEAQGAGCRVQGGGPKALADDRVEKLLGRIKALVRLGWGGLRSERCRDGGVRG